MAEPPDQPAGPSEDELRAMLDKRDQKQATEQHRLAGIGSRIFAIAFAGLAIGFFSFSGNREAVASMFREPAPEADPPRLTLPKLELLEASPTPAGEQESASNELIRAANKATAGPMFTPEGINPDGKIISKEDIGFAMQLLNFANGPPPRKVPPPAEKAKDK